MHPEAISDTPLPSAPSFIGHSVFRANARQRSPMEVEFSWMGSQQQAEGYSDFPLAGADGRGCRETGRADRIVKFAVGASAQRVEWTVACSGWGGGCYESGRIR